MLFSRFDPKTQNDIWVLPLASEPDRAPSKPYAWLATPFNEGTAKFSPDGRWVVYSSNESGRPEIYVAPFPGPGGKRQVSTSGGFFPRWRADGKEIFYQRPEGTLTAAEVSVRGASMEIGAVRPLSIPLALIGGYPYDASADGQRFLVAAPREQQSSAAVTLVQHWTKALRK